MGNRSNARKKRTNAKPTRTNARVEPRAYSTEEILQMETERIQYMDARAAELLNHDPELLELYHHGQQWKHEAKALQGELIDLVESEQLGDHVQNLIRSHKNVADRVREFDPKEFLSEGVASDCAEAIEAAAAALSMLAVDIRKKISELHPPEIRDVEQWEKVERAGLQAMMESLKDLGSSS